MTKDKTPEWLERAQAEIADRLKGMTPEEEAEYWNERSADFNAYKRSLSGSSDQSKAKVA